MLGSVGRALLRGIVLHCAVQGYLPDHLLEIDTSEVGQTFDGIGGLSGGGATSVLLKDYKEPQKSQILDYLFKPKFGASLQILKVEIGGDSQSTDGTEASHMHSADDLDYNRGYEWWLLSEAKKRNPKIKTYGLPWAYPGWVGGPEKSGDPFKHPELTSKYILKWLEGARDVYSIDIDYIGIWNERSSDAAYAKTLRKTLDAAGFANTTLVAKDGGADICDEMATDQGYIDAIGVVGLHYPSDFGDYSNCRKIGYGLDGKRNGKPIWASEESSSNDDLNGAACWARVITSHWVLQGMTSSIMWNLVGAYFHGTNWDASSMLTAQEPWSGNYHSLSPLWATAHVTQFTEVGWDLIKVGSGSGQLPKGGFYATYADPKSKDWTLTIVKIDEDHAPCTRPGLPQFNVTAETVTFKLSDSMQKVEELSVWYSNFEDFNPDGTVKSVFQRMPNMKVRDQTFSLEVKVGAFYTVTTIMDGPQKAETKVPPPQPSMPLPFHDDFENYTISQEGKWWSDQIGVFEVHYERNTSGNKVMKQMVPQLPIGWSDPGTNGPMSLIGMREWQDITIAASFSFPHEGADLSACLGSRVDQMWDNGIVLCISQGGKFTLSVGGPKLGGSPRGQIYKQGKVATLVPGEWQSLSLTTVGATATAYVNGVKIFHDVQIRDLDTGFAALGANDWFPIMFDHVRIDKAGPKWTPLKPECPSAKIGDTLHVRACAANGLRAEDQEFEMLADWGMLHVPSGLCASASSAKNSSSLVLAKCKPHNELQQFKNDYTRIRDTTQPFTLKAGDATLKLSGDTSGSVFVAESNAKSSGAWQKWSYFPNSKQLRNQYVADIDLGYPMCLSICRGSSFDVPSLIV